MPQPLQEKLDSEKNAGREVAALSVLAARGSLWVAISILVTQVVVMGVSIVMARLLTPIEFGLVEVSISLALLVNLVGEYGFSAEVIQRKTLSSEYLATTFWSNVLIGTGLTGFGIILGPWAAKFFETPEASPLLSLTMLNFFTNSFGVVQRATTVRAMNFKRVAQFEIIGIIIFASLSIGLLVTNWGIYSYVLAWLARTTLIAILFFVTADWRPVFIFRWQLCREMSMFGLSVMFGRSLVYFSGNLDRFVVWKGLGSVEMGYFVLARRLPTALAALLYSVVTKVTYPLMAQAQQDPVRLKRIYLRTIQLLAILILPVMFLLATLARPFTLVVFGSQWEPAIVPMQVIALVPMFVLIILPCDSAFQARGRPDLVWKNYALRTILLIPFLLTGLSFGIEGVAVGFVLSAFVSSLVTQRLVQQVIDLKWVEVLRMLLSPLRNSLFSVIAAVMMMTALRWYGQPGLIVLTISSSTGALTYMISFYLLDRAEFMTLLELFSDAIDFSALKHVFGL